MQEEIGKAPRGNLVLNQNKQQLKRTEHLLDSGSECGVGYEKPEKVEKAS